MTPRSSNTEKPCGSAAAQRAAESFEPSADGDRSLAFALSQSRSSKPVHVERLDRPGASYYLVPFYSKECLRAIVEVDAESCEVSKTGTIHGEKVEFLLECKVAVKTVKQLLPKLRDLLNTRTSRDNHDVFHFAAERQARSGRPR